MDRKPLDELTLLDLRILADLCDLEGEAPIENYEEAVVRLEEVGRKISKKDLSGVVRKLETTLGDRPGWLFSVGTGIGMKPTDVAIQLAANFRDFVEDSLEVLETKGISPHRINVGMTSMMTVYELPKLLPKCEFGADSLSGPDLTFVDDSARSLLAMVQRRDLDFAVCHETTYPPRHMGRTLLTEWPRILLYHKNHRLAASIENKKDNLKLLRDEILQDTLIIPTPIAMEELRRWLTRPTGNGRLIEVAQAALRRQWAEKCLGLAITHEPESVTAATTQLKSVDLSPALGGKTKLYLHYRLKPVGASGKADIPRRARPLVEELLKHFGKPWLSHEYWQGTDVMATQG